MFSKELAEIVLIVDNVEWSARFYREVVSPAPENDWAWFWAGEPGRDQRIALYSGPLLFEERSPLPEDERWVNVHYAFNVPRDRPEEAAEHVRQNATEVYGPVYFDWMKALSYYFFDPDRNLLEFWSSDPARRRTR